MSGSTDSIDFIIDQGANWNYVAFIQNPQFSPTPQNPLASPVNLQGCSAVMTAAVTPGALPKLFTLTTADGSLVINAAAGSITWNMPLSITAGFAAQPGLAQVNPSGAVIYLLGYYTMKITNAAGAVVRQFSGKLYLNPDV